MTCRSWGPLKTIVSASIFSLDNRPRSSVSSSKRTRESSATTRTSAISEKGFTLVEVLLAVVILSVGLTVVLTATSRCLAVMKKAQVYQNAIWALNAAETEHPLVVVTNDIKKLEVSDAKYGEFTYKRTVDSDDDDDGLYAVHSRVSWTERGGESYEEVVCYVLCLEDKQKK
jgi:prepilin-type N-terminal cleavage/methylation domain-containing protein